MYGLNIGNKYCLESYFYRYFFYLLFLFVGNGCVILFQVLYVLFDFFFIIIISLSFFHLWSCFLS